MEDSLKVILDHLGNTAVYIIRQDNHEILFYNEKVKEVTPHIKVGRVCHKLWRGSCENCPLIGMENKKINSTIGYDDPFGKRVDLTATITEWGEEKIPSYLITVTPRTMSKEERLAEERFEMERMAVYDSLPAAVAKFLVGEKLTFLEGGKQFYEMFGDPEEFIADATYGVYPDDVEFVVESLYKSANKHNPITLEYRAINRDGEIRWVRCEGKYIGEEIYPIYMIVIVDITKQKLRQFELEQKQVENQTSIENLRDIRFEYFPFEDRLLIRGCVETENKEIGIDKFTQNMDRLSIIHPSDILLVKEIIEGEENQGEIRVKNANSEEYSWRLVHTDALKKNEKVIKIIGTLHDITEEKKKDFELKKQKTLFNSTLDVLMGTAFERLIYLNLTSGELIMEKSKERGKGFITIEHEKYSENLISMIHPDFKKDFLERFSLKNLVEEFDKGKKSVYQEGLKIGENNQYYWISVEVVKAYKNEDGDDMAIMLTMDIDEKKKLEQQYQIMSTSLLTTYEELLILDIQSSKFTAYKTDEMSSRFIQSSKKQDFSEIVYLYGMQLIHPDDREVFFDMFNIEAINKIIYTGKHKFYIEVRRKNSNNEYRWSEITGTVIKNEVERGYNVLLTSKDVDEVHQIKREKEKADQRFVNTVNNFYDAIYEYDIFSEESVMWKSGKEYPWLSFGKSEKRPGRIFFLEYVKEEYQKKAMELLGRENVIDAFWNGVTEITAELPFRGNNNQYRWFSIQFQLLDKEAGKMRIMLYIKDIDNSKKEELIKENILRDALALAEKSNSAKSDFLSRMSHDIRTPMNAIIGMCTIAAANLNNPEKMGSCLGKIGVSARFLLSLINDVLDMAKIESGKLSITAEEFNLQELLKSIYVLCSEQARENHQEFIINVAASVEECYIGDPLRVNQVLLNLLSNAMKYTKRDGTIKLLLDIDSQARERSYLQIKVIDTGVGMSEKFLSRIFEPFEQEKIEDGRIFEGSGLGLSIAQNLVHLMDGTISVTSELGKGSEFVILLPLARIRKDDEPEEEKDQYLKDLSVLVVDDEQDVCVQTGIILKKMGVKAKWVTDGECAIEEVKESVEKKQPFDAAIIDWKMPGLNGIDTVKEIRKVRGTNMLVIIMSAYDWAEIEEEAKEAGADFFLPKPIFESSVRSILHRINRLEKEFEYIKEKEVEFNKEKILLVEDSELNREIAQTLLEMKNLTVEVAVNGKEAVELFQAAPCGYYQAILMDIRMPIMNGLEATNKIRHLGKEDSKTIPIVAMTANAFQDEQQEAKKVGMTAYLTKPIEVKELYQILAEKIKECKG